MLQWASSHFPSLRPSLEGILVRVWYRGRIDIGSCQRSPRTCVHGVAVVCIGRGAICVIVRVGVVYFRKRVVLEEEEKKAMQLGDSTALIIGAAVCRSRHPCTDRLLKHESSGSVTVFGTCFHRHWRGYQTWSNCRRR